MAWIMDTYSTREGYSVPGVVTGKPRRHRRLEGPVSATGRGVSYVTLATLKHLGLAVEDARIVVQGFGNVGSHAVQLLEEMGCIVVGVSDVQGGVYNPDGLSYRADHARPPGRVARGVRGRRGADERRSCSSSSATC